MPKEVIRGDSVAYGTPDEPRGYGAVEVRWGRETGYFQIATKCLDAFTGETYVPPSVEVQPTFAPGTVQATSPDEPQFIGELIAVEGPMPVQEGFYVNLDRRGINELIRVLRRARDQAFGRDE